MARTPLAAILALAFSVPAMAGDLDDVVNPLENAAVGEWAEYQIAMQTDSTEGTNEQEGTSRMKVVEVEGFRVAIEITGTLQEGDKKVHLMSTAPYKSLLTGGYDDVQIEKSSVERGTIEVAGKSYAVQIVHLEFTARTSIYGMSVPCKVDQTVWMSHDVPVTGLVKQETSVDMEILGQPVTSRTTTLMTGSGTE